MITLYSIQGINRTDTPYFENITQQAQFFNQHIYKAFLDMDYPPRFKNAIKFNLSDLDYFQGGSIDIVAPNYLSISRTNERSKTYYYFISSIEYITQDVLLINIELDYIQTYMFDIQINSCLINRGSIKRWKDIKTKEINRDYIRENFSTNNMIEIETDTTDISPVFTCYLVYASDSLHDIMNKQTTREKILFNEDGRYDETENGGIALGYHYDPNLECDIGGYVYLLVTYYQNGSKLKNKNYHSDPEIDLYYNYTSGMLFLQQAPEVANIIKLPFVPSFIKFNKGVLENTYEALCNKGLMATRTVECTDDHKLKLIYLPYINNVLTNILIKQSWINFEPNSVLKQPFNTKFIPFLLDNSYMNISIGERTNKASYPLYELDQVTDLHYYLGIDLITGKRFGFIDTNDGSETYKLPMDKYNTITYYTTDISAILMSDAWQEYFMRHKAYPIEVGEEAFVDLAKTTITALLSAVTTAYFTGNPIAGKITGFSTAALGVLNTGQTITNAAFNYSDLINTPDMIKASNTISLTMSGRLTDLQSKLERVPEYEFCGLFIEQSGYKLNKLYMGDTDTTNIFKFNNVRYYYNSIVCDNINMNFKANAVTAIPSEDIFNNIKSRFQTGLRLWNVNNAGVKIGDYTYDNVETEFIGG